MSTVTLAAVGLLNTMIHYSEWSNPDMNFIQATSDADYWLGTYTASMFPQPFSGTTVGTLVGAAMPATSQKNWFPKNWIPGSMGPADFY